MANKGLTFPSFVSRTPIITLNKLMGSENYLLQVDYVEVWFIDNDCEDHLTTSETSIAEDKHSRWRKIDVLLYNILQQSINAKTL